MTKNRKELLEILTEDEQPLNASQLHERTKGEQDLATIYRGLNYLEAKGYIISFVFDCKDRGVERYYNIKKERHDHYMHCEKCHSFTVFSSCPIQTSLSEIEEHYGFIVDEHYLTLKGVCRNCADKNEKDLNNLP